MFPMPKTFCEVGRLLITRLSCIQRREQIDYNFSSLAFGWIYRNETLFNNNIAHMKQTWRWCFGLVLNWRSIWAFVILSFCQLNGICAYCETDVMSHVSFKTARHHCFFGNVEWIIRTIKYASCLSTIGARSSELWHVCHTPYNTQISKTFYESR